MNAAVDEPGSRWRTMRFPLFAVLLAAVAIPAAAWWHTFRSTDSPAPDFTLTGAGGRPFVLSAQRGHPVVIFFGYTHCADACPTTLSHIAAAVRLPDVPRDVRVAFITVDPARDTARQLERYVALFDPSFFGLTGGANALDRVYADYHVVRQNASDGAGTSGYTVMHTTTIYYVGRGGSIGGFGNWDDAPATIAADVKRLR